MLNTEWKYANVNHMANLFLFGLFAFCFFSMTTLLQLGVCLNDYIAKDDWQLVLQEIYFVIKCEAMFSTEWLKIFKCTSQSSA